LYVFYRTTGKNFAAKSYFAANARFAVAAATTCNNKLI